MTVAVSGSPVLGVGDAGRVAAPADPGRPGQRRIPRIPASEGRTARKRAAACSMRSACQVSTRRRSWAATASRCSTTSAGSGVPAGSASCRQRRQTASATSRFPLIRARSTTGSSSSRLISSSTVLRMARFMPASACTVSAPWTARSRAGRSRNPNSRDSSPLPGSARSAVVGAVSDAVGGHRTPISGTSCSNRHCSLSRVFIAAIRSSRSRLAVSPSDSSTPANSPTSSSAGTAIARSALTSRSRSPACNAATAAACASRIASASMPGSSNDGSSNDIDAVVSSASDGADAPSPPAVSAAPAPSPSRSPLRLCRSPVRPPRAAGPAPGVSAPRPSVSRC